MHDDVAVVLDHPFVGVVALDAEAFFSLGRHGGVDFFRHVVNLAAAVGGGQNEKIEERSDAPHVENGHVVGLVICGDASAQESVLNGDLGTRGRQTTWHRSELQRTSFRHCKSCMEVRKPLRSVANWVTTSIAVGHLQAGSEQNTDASRPALEPPGPALPRIIAHVSPSVKNLAVFFGERRHPQLRWHSAAAGSLSARYLQPPRRARLLFLYENST